MSKLDLTKPVSTRDGRKVRVLCTDLKGVHPIVGVVTRADGEEVVLTWLPDGRLSFNVACPGDLINVPERHVRWVNVYRGLDGRMWGASLCVSREMADAHADCNRIACLRIEFEEGQGLDGEGEP